MTVLELRPMTLGEILDRTFTIYRRHFWLFIGIMLLPETVMLALSLLTTVLPLAMVDGGDPSPAAAMAVGMGMIVLTPVVFLGFLGAYAAAHGATVSAVSCLAMGAATSIGQAYRQVRRRFWRLLVVVILVAMLAGAAFILTFFVVAIPGALLMAAGQVAGFVAFGLLLMAGMIVPLWLMARMGVAVAAAVLEPGGGVAALSRSMELTRGYSGRVLVTVIFVIVLMLAAYGIFELPLYLATAIYGVLQTAPVWLIVVAKLGSFVSGLLVGPIGAIAFALIYYDLRMRKEGFDLQLMMFRLEAAAQAAAPPSPQMPPPQPATGS
jgi:hypothetical protein